jgi:quercetin dioxygenase-like cupin family protein
MTSESDKRQIVASASANMLPYDMEGPLQPDIGWLPLSYDRRLGQGSYLMRLQPGARTIAHDHLGFEDFVILEGELVDSDGRVLRPGDFISYRPGTRHNSWTKTGCLIAVFEWRPGTQATELG